jgi:hypothetical protein
MIAAVLVLVLAAVACPAPCLAQQLGDRPAAAAPAPAARLARRPAAATAAAGVREAFRARREVGLHKLNPVYPELESAWFQPLSLSSDILVSKFAFKFNLCRCSEASRHDPPVGATDVQGDSDPGDSPRLRARDLDLVKRVERSNSKENSKPSSTRRRPSVPSEKTASDQEDQAEQLLALEEQLRNVTSRLGDTEQQLDDTRQRLNATEVQLNSTKQRLSVTVQQLKELNNTMRRLNDTAVLAAAGEEVCAATLSKLLYHLTVGAPVHVDSP